MSASDRRCLIEPLENRRYAKATPTLGIALPAVSYGRDGSVYIQGSIGDDRLSFRYVRRQIYVEIATRIDIRPYGDKPIYGGITVDPSHTRLDNTFNTATWTENGVFQGSQGFVIPLAGHPVITIEGGNGSDTVVANQMPVNIVASQMEATAITPAVAPAGATPSDPATGSLYGSPKAWADKLHRQLKAVKTSRAEIAFFGDSHADRFEYYGRRSWLAAFPKALNLGVGGDNTRNMLFRIKAGLFDTFKPRTLVVMAGTNNLNNTATDGTDSQVYDGMTAVLAALRGKLPNTRLVVVSVFPRSESGLNMRILTLNAMLKAYAERGGGFEFLNVYDRLADTFDRHDLVNLDNHLSAPGYQVVTRYLTGLLKSPSPFSRQVIVGGTLLSVDDPQFNVVTDRVATV